MLDVQKIRADFPMLQQKLYGKPYIYFDNGATTQKPQAVIDEINLYNSLKNSNIHRGVHFFSNETTAAYEKARQTIAAFINANSEREIIFTSGTTESINLVAYSFGERFIKDGDEIIVAEMEHHSNIVPWQLMCDRKNAKIKVLPFDDSGCLLIELLPELINNSTKLIAVTHISNTLGTINPVEEICKIAHSRGVKVLIDGAQSIQHAEIDVKKMDCDFYAFSGHKLYGPTGIGVLYAKEELFEKMPPYKGGGDMIKNVSFERTTFADLPFKFEAGTTNYVGAIGMAKAVEYIKSIGIENITAYEKELLNYALEKLHGVEGLKIYGETQNKSSVISFSINKIHSYDLGTILDKLGIAVRTGTHCSEPVMQHFGLSGMLRVSLAFYNTKDEVDVLIEAINRAKLLLE